MSDISKEINEKLKVSFKVLGEESNTYERSELN